MSDAVNLRAARPEDLPAILALDPSAATDQRRREFIDAALCNGWITAALVDDTLVGFAVAHRHFFCRPFLALLIVDAAHRGRGIARGESRTHATWRRSLLSCMGFSRDPSRFVPTFRSAIALRRRARRPPRRNRIAPAPALHARSR